MRSASTKTISSSLAMQDSAIDVYSELESTKNTLYAEEQCHLNIAKFYHHLQTKYPNSQLENNLFVVYLHNGNNAAVTYGKKGFSFHAALLYFDSEKNDWYFLDYDAPTTLACPVSQPVTARDAVQKMFAKSDYLQTCLDEAIDVYPDTCHRAHAINQMMLFSLAEWDKIKNIPNLVFNIPIIESHKVMIYLN